MKRLFFALPIPVPLKKQILQSFPQKTFVGIRFTSEENLHLTTHFLGAVPEDKLGEIILLAEKIAATASSFDLKLESYQTVIRNRKPVMIWAQFEESAGFEGLCLKLRKAFPTEENRTPNPHATLARIKQLKQLPFNLPIAKPSSFIASQIELWESKTESTGATYSKIVGWKLG